MHSSSQNQFRPPSLQSRTFVPAWYHNLELRCTFVSLPVLHASTQQLARQFVPQVYEKMLLINNG